jgi:hypothetical protein
VETTILKKLRQRQKGVSTDELLKPPVDPLAAEKKVKAAIEAKKKADPFGLESGGGLVQRA